MILKIINPKKDGKNMYHNNGSCFPLIQYLSKEDDELGSKKEYFFSHSKDVVMASEVLSTIDSYRKGLEKKDTKFYSLVVAPSDKEINCMTDARKELKDYTRAIMDIYAANFNGLTKAKNLKGEDLVYFAKVEFNRHYKGSDKEVIEGVVEQGTLKPGNNMHVHIVVARKDKSNTYKISPLVKNRKLFSIEGMKLKSCYKFDEVYLVNTSAKELEEHMIKRDKNDLRVKEYAQYKPNYSSEEMMNSSKIKNQNEKKNESKTNSSLEHQIQQFKTKNNDENNESKNKITKKKGRGFRF